MYQHSAGRIINLVLIAQFEFICIALAQPVWQNEYTSDTNMNSDLNLRSHGKIIIIVEFWQQFCMHSNFLTFFFIVNFEMSNSHPAFVMILSTL